MTNDERRANLSGVYLDRAACAIDRAEHIGSAAGGCVKGCPLCDWRKNAVEEAGTFGPTLGRRVLEVVQRMETRTLRREEEQKAECEAAMQAGAVKGAVALIQRHREACRAIERSEAVLVELDVATVELQKFPEPPLCPRCREPARGVVGRPGYVCRKCFRTVLQVCSATAATGAHPGASEKRGRNENGPSSEENGPS